MTNLTITWGNALAGDQDGRLAVFRGERGIFDEEDLLGTWETAELQSVNLDVEFPCTIIAVGLAKCQHFRRTIKLSGVVDGSIHIKPRCEPFRDFSKRGLQYRYQCGDCPSCYDEAVREAMGEA